MQTDKEMLEIAEKYLIRMTDDDDIEAVILDIEKKEYGNIYFFNNKKYIETGEFRYAIGNNAPFLVEKEKRRVVQFGTSGKLELQIEAYENGTFTVSLNTYW